MTLIAPSTLIAIQSYAAPTPAGRPKPAVAFEPIAAADLVAPAAMRSGDVDVSLSREAQAYLATSGTPEGDAAKAQRLKAVAVPAPDSRPPAPAGSTLDITV